MRRTPLLWVLLLSLLLLGAKCESDARWIVTFGDSLTSGRKWFVGMPRNWIMIDRGVAGETCAEVVARLENDMPDLRGETVVIQCGTNDVRRGGYTLSGTASEVELGILVGQALGLRVVVVAPPPQYDFKGETVNSRLEPLHYEIESLAQLHGAGFADLWEPIWNHPDPLSLYEPDGIHLNADGRRLMADLMHLALLLR